MGDICLSCTLTMFHDGQFWVGAVEERDGTGLSAARVVFGSEPSDEQVMELVRKRWNSLRFSPKVEAMVVKASGNPKRRQREAAKELARRGASTKAQEALSEQMELLKAKKKSSAAAERHAKDELRHELRSERRKAKRRGK